jgi:GTP cyclohydrolase II
MNKEKIIEGNAQEQKPQGAPQTPAAKPKEPESILKGVLRTAEEIGQTIGGAIQTRDSVVMVRVHKDVLGKLDMLVDAEICKSRSEAAAHMISEGIKANAVLYQKIGGVIETINKLRAELKQNIQSEIKKQE